MVKPPAIDTSSLIFLTKADLLDLLLISNSKIIVPQAVATEIKAYGYDDITAMALVSTDWLIEAKTSSVPPIIQNWDLGIGESAVLTWGYVNPGTEVILDDLAARRCANALNIPVRGTLGLVIAAKQRGNIPAARPILEKLRSCGMYISDKVINRVLTIVGE